MGTYYPLVVCSVVLAVWSTTIDVMSLSATEKKRRHPDETWTATDRALDFGAPFEKLRKLLLTITSGTETTKHDIENGANDDGPTIDGHE